MKTLLLIAVPVAIVVVAVLVKSPEQEPSESIDQEMVESPELERVKSSTQEMAKTTEQEAEATAKELADAIRDFNDAFGDVVQGEMTPTQIDEFERMITPVFDVDKVHNAQCASVAMASVTTATVYVRGQQNPAMAEMANDARSELVIGSIRDWLFEFSVPLIQSLGFQRTVAAAKYQCLQKKYVHAMYSDLPMYSLEMIAAEDCLLNQVCD